MIRVDGIKPAFSVNFNNVMEIPKGSMVSLQNIAIDVENGNLIKLDNDMIVEMAPYNISDWVKKLPAPNAPSIISALIPKGTYTKNQLAQELTRVFNNKLYFLESKVLPYGQHQGAEIVCTIKENNLKPYMSFNWSARSVGQSQFLNSILTSQEDGNADLYTFYNRNNLEAIELASNVAFTGLYKGFAYTNKQYFSRGSGAVKFTNNNDYTNAESSGILVGLTLESDIDPLVPLNTLKNVSYGIANFYGHNYTQAQLDIDKNSTCYSIKKSRDTVWELTTIDATDQNVSSNLMILLGKISADLTNPLNAYNIYFNFSGVDPVPNNDLDPQFVQSTSYLYNDYILITGLYFNNAPINYKPIENIGWTNTLITNLSYNNDLTGADHNLGYSKNNDYGLYLNLNSIKNATLLGFETLTKESDKHKNSTIFSIDGDNSMTTIFNFPSSIVLRSDIPTYCYDNGEEAYLLSNIPVDKDVVSNSIIYQPSPPVNLSIKNNNLLMLDHINFRLTDKSNVLIEGIQNVALTLLISSNE